MSITPTSPTDFTSLSSSMSDRNMSPLSPGNESTEMDIMLPGMPNLRDEDGLPLSYPSPEQTKRDKYSEFIKESGIGERNVLRNNFPNQDQGFEEMDQRHMQQNDFPGQGFGQIEQRHIQQNDFPGQGFVQTEQRHIQQNDRNGGQMDQSHMGQNNFPGQGQGFVQTEQMHVQGNIFPKHGREMSGPSNEEAAPPLPPPRNYSSHYRSEFHSKQSPARSRQTQNDPASSQHSLSDHGASNASNSRTNLSQDMDGSLMDLADELGGGRTSSTSLHSSSGRRSQTDVGVASRYQRDMPNGKCSVSNWSNSYVALVNIARSL